MWCQPRGLVPPVVSTSLLAVLAVVPTVAVGAPPESATVLAQTENLGLVTRTAIRFLATLIVGGLLAVGVTAFAPRFAEERVRAASDRPGGYLLWGLLGAVVVPVVLAILAATVVGLLIALPGLLAQFVAGLAGTGIAVLWVGSWLTDGSVVGSLTGRSWVDAQFWSERSSTRSPTACHWWGHSPWPSST